MGKWQKAREQTEKKLCSINLYDMVTYIRLVQNHQDTP